ncbi:hypothetical protein ACFU53_36190 [Streptomyces sp. NPDC057474]|uniref:hypothetical protein n=1 Tax=Streptomyces sp. NPDC057474 TaxID=3346144 RepID=UPI003687413D
MIVVVGRSYTYDREQGQEQDANQEPGQSQDSDGGAPEAVLAHYRDAAPAHGWTHRSGSDCYSKRVDGTMAYLSLYESAGGVLEVEIMSSHEDFEPFC